LPNKKNVMNEILLIEATERYLNGEMNAEEKKSFEAFRESNADANEFVIAHLHFIQNLHNHANTVSFKQNLNEVQSSLEITAPSIFETTNKKGAKLISFWNKYKKNIAVAASIAGFVSLFTSGVLVNYNNHVGHNNITELDYKIKQTEKKVDQLNNSIITGQIPVKLPPSANYRATGFLLDGKGYILTNAHVANKMKTIYVENSKGQYFTATAIYTDKNTDLAILKIVDSSFKTVLNLPYSFKKTNADLGEQLFTLGFPRNEIVYGEGYLSAKTGNDGDSTAYQLSVTVSPGNSGGPVLNKNGEVIGIITSKSSNDDGAVYAAKSKSIFEVLEALKKTNEKITIKLPTSNSLKGVDRVQQIRKMEEFVYMVIGN
jgi:serine protease Do